tara:strand:- start:409 stop:678 length:270 start_codon:yes stop_codon:yes gene_type:complete
MTIERLNSMQAIILKELFEANGSHILVATSQYAPDILVYDLDAYAASCRGLITRGLAYGEKGDGFYSMAITDQGRNIHLCRPKNWRAKQ